MKFVREDVAGGGHTRQWFAIGKAEVEILRGVLENARLWTPKILETETVRMRVNQMIRELDKHRPHIRDNVKKAG